MNRLLVYAALATSACLPAHAHEALEATGSARIIAASPYSLPAKLAEAPFRKARDPLPEMLLREELDRRGPAGACQENAAALCYDLADGRVVYRPARAYMPRIDGLRAESVSLRRDRIVLKYSFR